LGSIAPMLAQGARIVKANS